MDIDSTVPKATPSGTNEPFTVPERIQQLAEIDKQIVKLMHLSAEALTALTPEAPKTSTASGSETAASSNSEAFKASMNSLLSTLHTVDVQMKRQILGLEEAGIIVLENDRQDADASRSAAVAGPRSTASVQPNAVGTVGALDVGWLNSRSGKVDREIEAELWEQARTFLDKVDAL